MLDYLRHPAALTLDMVVNAARAISMSDLADDLADRKGRRRIPHKFERAGYVPVRNPDADDGLWKVAGRRQSVYGRRTAMQAEQIRAARGLL